MIKGIIRVSTRNMSREEWLNRRRLTVGGSDAAAIVGLSKWASPYSVWADKTGRIPPKEDNEAMRLGRDLEDYVARRWMEETGKRVHRVQAMMYSPIYPFAHADVDRLIVGENAGLECKTTSTINLLQFRGNNNHFPEQYYAQCVHYMAVTGADRWYLAVLVFGRGFFTFTLKRNQAEIDALMHAESLFWKHVQEDNPPQIDGTEASSKVLQQLHPNSVDVTVNLFGREAALKEYMDLRAQRKSLDSRIGEIENNIKADMGTAATGTCGSFHISWKTQSRQTFQVKEFARDHPAIDLTPYYKNTMLRTFKVTKDDRKEEKDYGWK